MNEANAHCLEILDRRIALLESLAKSLAAAREEAVGLNVDEFEERIREQESFCAQIQDLDRQISRIQKDSEAQLRWSADTFVTLQAQPEARLQQTLTRLNEAQATVQRLNSEHKVLLRRSRRTVSALLNSYRSFALTYSRPGA